MDYMRCNLCGAVTDFEGGYEKCKDQKIFVCMDCSDALGNYDIEHMTLEEVQKSFLPLVQKYRKRLYSVKYNKQYVIPNLGDTGYDEFWEKYFIPPKEQRKPYYPRPSAENSGPRLRICFYGATLDNSGVQYKQIVDYAHRNNGWVFKKLSRNTTHLIAVKELPDKIKEDCVAWGIPVFTVEEFISKYIKKAE